MKNHQENIIILHTRYIESNYNEQELSKLIQAINPLLNIMVKNSTESEDIKQEIILKFIESWGRKKIEYGDFYKYLCHKISNFVKDYKRHKINFKGLSDREKRRLNFIYHKKDKTEEDIKEYNKLKEKIIFIDNIEYDNLEFNYTIFDECKDILTQEEYNLIEMRYKKNMTLKDIGAVMNISHEGVNKKINNILEKLKEELIVY